MMISPEWYIEREIKGKSKRHVLAEIRRLKRSIAKLERHLKNPTKKFLCAKTPSPLTVLGCEKAYLAAAEEYLANNF